MEINQCILGGHVGADPEVKTIGANKLAKFRLATSRKFTKNGETVKETQWHTIEAWNKKADLVENFVRKGSAIFVSGELKYSEYEAKDSEGNPAGKRKETKIVAEKITFLGGAKNESAQPSVESAANDVRSYVADQEEAPVSQPSMSAVNDDDLPF